MLTWMNICVHFSQSLRESQRERAGVDTNIAGAGGSDQKLSGSGQEWTQTLRERAGLEHAGGSGRSWSETQRERAGVDTNIAGAGGTGTRRRERAGLEHAGGSGRFWSETQRERVGAGLRKQSRAGLYIKLSYNRT